MDYLISIIIPTWRDSDILTHCLKSLLEQNYPKNKYEIILISQNKLTICNPQIRTVKIAKGINHALARNIGVKYAHGQIIAFCDDDCVLPKNWLKNGALYFHNLSVDLVGGPVTPPPNMDFRHRLGGYLSGSRFTTGFAAAFYHPIYSEKESDGSNLILANTFIRKKTFAACGGFDANQVPCEESLLCFNLIKRGCHLIYSPKVACSHIAKPVFFPWAQKVFFYATGRGQLVARKPTTFHIQYLIPSLFVVSIFLTIILTILKVIPVNIALALGSTYLLLNLINALIIYLRFEKNLIILIAAPIATFLVHIAYGLGFLHGYFRFLLGKQSAVRMPNKT